jgi:hypothetical protein
MAEYNLPILLIDDQLKEYFVQRSLVNNLVTLDKRESIFSYGIPLSSQDAAVYKQHIIPTSKFGKYCPITLHNETNCLPFQTSEEFPVVYKGQLYFPISAENRLVLIFFNSLLKVFKGIYIKSCKICQTISKNCKNSNVSFKMCNSWRSKKWEKLFG